MNTSVDIRFSRQCFFRFPLARGCSPSGAGSIRGICSRTDQCQLPIHSDPAGPRRIDAGRVCPSGGTADQGAARGGPCPSRGSVAAAVRDCAIEGRGTGGGVLEQSRRHASLP
jgi:hypothetical protein